MHCDALDLMLNDQLSPFFVGPWMVGENRADPFNELHSTLG